MITPQVTWVVEVDEVKLQACASPGMQWWAVRLAAPFDAWRQRLTVVASAIPGDIVYVRCDNRDEANEFRGWALDHGCHPKAITVRRIGHTITCKGCTGRRPYWATARARPTQPGGQMCRPCYDARFARVPS